MKNIRAGSKSIGKNFPCFVIAESSVNFSGSLSRAKKMIDTAKEAGADAVKFQVFSAKYCVADTDDPKTILKAKEYPQFVKRDTKLIDFYKTLELPRRWLPSLAAHAKKRQIMFFATPADVSAVDQLERVSVPMYKIGSYEMQDVTLLEAVAKTGKPVIISTGMATVEEISASMRVLRNAGAKEIVLLHCRSTYPLPADKADLRIINTLKKGFRVPVGFSDHSVGVGVAVAAVVLGADVIEKHFRLDDGVAAADDTFALKPDELRLMVVSIRQAEVAIGAAKKVPTADERLERAGRRSLWVIKKINKGEVFTKDHLRALQPATGISPLFLNKVIGKKSKQNISKNSPLKKSHFN